MVLIELNKLPMLINFLRTVTPLDRSREHKLARLVEENSPDKVVIEELLKTLEEAEKEFRALHPSVAKEADLY